MSDPEKTIRDSIRHTLDGWPAGPFTHADDCKGCRITAALDQLVALPPTRLDRRTRETLEAAGRALNDAERTLRLRLVYGPGLTTSLRDAHRQIVHLLAEDEGEVDGTSATESELLRAALRSKCWELANYTFRGKNISLGEESDEHYRDALAAAEAAPPAGEEEPRCTGYCIFDGDALTHPDLCCPIHGSEAQAKAGAVGLEHIEWMKACRASWPFAPAAVPKGQSR